MENEISTTLREWRTLAGLTQDRAALALRMSVDRYRRVEQGKCEPTGDEYLAIREVIRKAKVES